MKYDYIHSMRGIAILMVMLVHTSQVAYGLEGFTLNFAAFGQMGVQLFFVISAFTLCLSFERRGKEAHPRANFFIRRFFRIAPAYIIIGILGYMLFRIAFQYIDTNELIVPPLYSLYKVLSNVFFVHGLYPPGINVVPGGWSIGAEMLFYLMFPTAFILLRQKLTSMRGILLFPLVMVIFSHYTIKYVLDHGLLNNDFVYFSLLNQLSVFAVGISLYLFHKGNSQLLDKINSCWLLCLFVMISLLTSYLGWFSDIKGVFSIVPFFAAISFVPLIELFKRKHVLNNKLLMSIGEHSYSMYLIHFVFAHQLSMYLNNLILLEAVGPIISLMITYIITVFITFNLSKVSYVYIETYFISTGKMLINKIP